jgi:outer membrane protein assembly factor BamB/tetratricopeptide (TPR) repeat protein
MRARVFIRSLIAALVVLGASSVWGQMRVLVGPGMPQVVGGVPQGADQNPTGVVYVRDSAMAMEKLALARRMERLHEWGKSADVYQEILEKYSDRVVAAHEDPQSHVVDQYASVTETVRQSLCKWPEDGLTVYRGQYETPAAALFNAAGNDGVQKLHEVLWRFFPTDSAREAGIRLMDVYFEEGDYAAVNQIGKELLDWHPNLLAQRPMVLYRTALAAKLAGQADESKRCLDELQRQFPQSTGVIRGQEVLLTDSLTLALSRAGIVQGQGAEGFASASDSWPTVGGDESRSKICSSTVKPGARLYTIPIMGFDWNQIPSLPERQQRQHNDEDLRAKGVGLGIMPAVFKGQLFFQDNTRIYGRDLDGDEPLAAWVETYPKENGVYKVPGNPSPVPLGRQLCVTVNDKYVAAVTGLSDPWTQDLSPPGEDSRLVCLDRKTGRKIWTTTLLDLPDSQTALRALQMGGSPLFVGDNLYVLVHGIKGQFEDCYVACFALATGKFRWATFIANSGIEPWFGPMGDEAGEFSDAVSHIAYAGGRIFVVTNLGAVASVDAFTGAIAWLDIYRTESSPPGLNFNPALLRFRRGAPGPEDESVDASAPWIYNPAVVQDGNLFVLPADSHSLFVYDAADGKPIKQIPLSGLQETLDPNVQNRPDLPSTLLGVRGDLVYLAGARQVWQVPWRTIPQDPANVDSTPRYWRSTEGDQYPSKQAHGDQDLLVQVRGRGFVTADAVYLPTQKYLLRILISSGLLDSVNSSFPRGGWEEGKEGPGNVVVTQDHLIVAGDRQVAVYTDLALARAKLDREIADGPADPEARLHYAEVMFAAAEPDVAERRMEEAFQLLGGVQSPRVGPSRERAFNDALSFARRSLQKETPPQQIERFFDLARAAATSATQQVSYRMARAGYDWSRPNRDATGAIQLYQEILGDPSYRAISMPDPQTTGDTPAGTLAEKAIREILGTPDGHMAYEQFEQAAAQKLRDALAAADPEQLLDISKVYPDSHVAGAAMMAAAQCYESRGDARMATQVLRQILLRVHDRDRVPVLEALARNYLKLPNHLDVAVSRLGLAANLAPHSMILQPLMLPGGTVLQNVSLSSARDVLMRYESQSSLESLPDLHLPTHQQSNLYWKAMGQRAKPFGPESPNTKIVGVDAMVVPLEDCGRNDRIIAWSAADGLSVYPVGQNKPLFKCAGINEAPIGAAWMEGNVLVWSNGSIALVDGASGRQRWSVDVSTLPAIVASGDLGAAPAENGPEEVAEVRPVNDRIVLTTTTGRLLGIDPAAGRVAWQTRVGGAVNPLLANDDFTVVRTQDSQTAEIQVYNSLSGELLGRKSFGLDTAAYPINLALAADGTLVYTLPGQLCIQDLFEANLSPQGMEPGVANDVELPNQPPMFLGAGRPQPEQLLIHGGRVFAVANSGKEVRIYSIDTGDLWQTEGRNGPETTGVVATWSTSANVRLHISGNYLFVFSPRNLVTYRIDPPKPGWDWKDDPTRVTNYKQILFGKDYVALVDRPGPPATESNRPGNRVTLNFFNRMVKELPDEEAGFLLFNPEFPVIDDNLALQAVEGGVAYFTGHTIQFLVGARDLLPNVPPI